MKNQGTPFRSQETKMGISFCNIFDDMSINWCTGIFQKYKLWKNMSYLQKINYFVTCCLWILIAIPITVTGISIAVPFALLIALGMTVLAMFVDLVRGTVYITNTIGVTEIY